MLKVTAGISEVRDVENVADVLVDPEGSLERRNHWEKTSHSWSAPLSFLGPYRDPVVAQVTSRCEARAELL